MTKPLFLFIATFCVITSFAQQKTSSAELKEKQATIQKEIDDLRRSLDETKKHKNQSLTQLNLIQKKLSLREQQIATVNQQIDLIQGNINQSSKEIVVLRTELDTLKLQYQQSIVYAYKNRGNYDFISFVFSASSFNDALKRVAYLRTYRAYREQQVANIYKTQNLLQEKITDLNTNKEEKNNALEEQSRQRAILEEDKKEQDALVRQLKTKEKKISKYIADKRRQDMALRSAINAAVQREIAAARKREAEELAAKKAAEAAERKKEAAAKKIKPSTKATTTVATVKPKTTTKPDHTLDSDLKEMSASFERNRGNLPWPMATGKVTMHFGRQVYAGNIIYYNEGITIEAATGTTVKAVFSGKISSVFSVADGKEAVIIRHGKYMTTYSNLGHVNVSAGQQVKSGEAIGKLGDREDGRGELEFIITMWENNTNVDPEKWLR